MLTLADICQMGTLIYPLTRSVDSDRVVMEKGIQFNLDANTFCETGCYPTIQYVPLWTYILYRNSHIFFMRHEQEVSRRTCMVTKIKTGQNLLDKRIDKLMYFHMKKWHEE